MLDIYDPPDDGENKKAKRVETPYVLEREIGMLREMAPDLGISQALQQAAKRVDGYAARVRVDTESVLPGAVFCAVGALFVAVVVRHRPLPQRIALPWSAFAVLAYANYPRTLRNIVRPPPASQQDEQDHLEL